MTYEGAAHKLLKSKEACRHHCSLNVDLCERWLGSASSTVELITYAVERFKESHSSALRALLLQVVLKNGELQLALDKGCARASVEAGEGSASSVHVVLIQVVRNGLRHKRKSCQHDANEDVLECKRDLVGLARVGVDLSSASEGTLSEPPAAVQDASV